MSSKQFRLGLVLLSGLLICAAVGAYFTLSSGLPAEEGTEVTPARYSKMRRRWAGEGPDHYRLVASYHWEVVGGCAEDVEVLNVRVIRTYRSDCEGSGTLTVSKIFSMFQEFVGQGSTRPLAIDGCRYYYVSAIFDRATGYPLYIKSHLISAPTRGLYISLEQSFSAQSCLTIGVVALTATVESVTPLE